MAAPYLDRGRRGRRSDRWRAYIVRIPGVPTALMPFYGPTPDEAAGHLRQWLTRAHERAPPRSNPSPRRRLPRTRVRPHRRRAPDTSQTAAPARGFAIPSSPCDGNRQTGGPDRCSRGGGPFGVPGGQPHRGRAGPPAAVASAARQAPARDQTTESPLRSPDFDRMRRQQAETDRAWRDRERRLHADREDRLPQPRRRPGIPAFVFQPLTVGGREAIRRSSGSTRTSAGISTSTTSRTSARRRRAATW